MEFPEVLKNKGVLIGGAVVLLIIIIVVARRNSGGGSTPYYTGPGTLTSQQAVELAGLSINASVQSESIAAGEKVDLANIAALKAVNLGAQRTSLSESKINASVENNAIAANQAVAFDTNKTLVSLANIAGLTAEDINNPSMGAKIFPFVQTTLANATQGFSIFTNWFKIGGSSGGSSGGGGGGFLGKIGSFI